MNSPITKVTKHLYLGNEFDAASRETLLKHNISTILNVAPFHCPPHFAGEPFFKYGMVELKESDVDTLRDELEKCLDFIGSLL